MIFDYLLHNKPPYQAVAETSYCLESSVTIHSVSMGNLDSKGKENNLDF